MARIRSVHPAICADATLVDVSASAERTFVRLWTHLDDDGRAEDNVKLIKAALYPLHDGMTFAKVAADLNELAAQGLILRYEVRGKRVLCAKEASWREWQKPRHPTASKLPGLDDPEATTRSDGDTGSDRRNATAKRRKPTAGVVVGEGVGVERESLSPAVQATGESPARTVARRFWEQAHPQPTVKFIALVKLVERFLTAGWSEDEVDSALHRTKAFTLDAIEFTLRQTSGPSKNLSVLQDFVKRGEAS